MSYHRSHNFWGEQLPWLLLCIVVGFILGYTYHIRSSENYLHRKVESTLARVEEIDSQLDDLYARTGPLKDIFIDGNLPHVEPFNVTMTAYTNGPESIDVPKWQDGITSYGTLARPGICAADPKRFTYGTLLWIPSLKSFCRVEDTGGKIKGWHIDIFVHDVGVAKRIGKTQQKIYRVTGI